MAEKISFLIENVDRRLLMGQQAYEDAQKYKMENIAKQWEELFQSITKKDDV